MRLGGPFFLQQNDPELWARAHKRAGYSAAYASCIESKYGLTDDDLHINL